MRRGTIPGVESQKWHHSAQLKTTKTHSEPKRRFTNMKLLHMQSELALQSAR